MRCNRQAIRRTMRQKRLALSEDYRFQTSLTTSQSISTAFWFRRSQHIAFYQAIGGEIDLSHLIQQAWKMQKNCYLPVCHPFCDKTLLFLPYEPDDRLSQNRYGILEPNINQHKACHPLKLDVVFIPLLAFDKYHNRLGSGKGYYDKTFAYLRHFSGRFRPMLVGLAYEFQEVEKIPTEIWDIPMSKIIVVE